MPKKVSVWLMVTLTISLLFSVKSPADGAVKPANEFRSSFHFTRRGQGLVLTGYSFPSMSTSPPIPACTVD